MKDMTITAKLFIGAMVAAGVAALAGGLVRWECKNPVRFLSFLIIAAVASRLKVKLPGTNGNLSVNLPFILIALAVLSLSETVLIAAASASCRACRQKAGASNLCRRCSMSPPWWWRQLRRTWCTHTPLSFPRWRQSRC